jgi:hypothetical protein
MLLQLEIEFADGTTEILISDDSWRCCRTDAYEARQLYGYQTAFSEHIDLRNFPAGWDMPGFDGSRWQAPLMGETRIPDVYNLAPQLTPPVAYHKVEPVRIVAKGDGRYFIDFGSELVGETVFIVSGEPGQTVEIRHGEETDGPDTVRYEMRCGCEYREVCTLSGRRDERIEFFDYKGFRYVEVIDWPEELTAENVWALQRHYPFPRDACTFSSSDKLLNDVWQLCANGVRVGTLDTYLDCPTREKGGFLGDGFITGLSHLVLIGDGRILRKFINDVANSARICPGLLSVAPTNVSGESAEYSMLWPVLLEHYYQWTGDLEFVRAMQPVLAGMLDYYAAYENADGLLQDVIGRSSGAYAVLVDWPSGFRDGYDDPLLKGRAEAAGVVNTMLNGFYYGSLNASARLTELAGLSGDARALRQKAERLREHCLAQLRDPETGLFVDRIGSTHSAFHANVLPLMTGVVPPEERDPILAFLRSKRMSCGVYFSFFLLKGLYTCGEGDFAYELITSRDRNSWHSMLAAGATTCMEAWDPDLKWNTSWCHPWSSAPVHMIAHELIGLRPGSPGWESIEFAPQPPLDLDSAELRITTPKGAVEAAFERQGQEIVYRLTVPPDCTASCSFVETDSHVLTAGTHEIRASGC